MAEHKMTCPACGGTFTAEDEAALFEKIHEHAHAEHGMHLTEEKFRGMLEQQKE
ncbi:MAG: DUF1059 domain-containing protein [Anaerolineae bacterium]|nr:DUF1059 domain-containing protein [Anaerolineae bacterium]